MHTLKKQSKPPLTQQEVSLVHLLVFLGMRDFPDLKLPYVKIRETVGNSDDSGVPRRLPVRFHYLGGDTEERT